MEKEGDVATYRLGGQHLVGRVQWLVSLVVTMLKEATLEASKNFAWKIASCERQHVRMGDVDQNHVVTHCYG